MTITEIKTFLDKQKPINDVVDIFFEGIKTEYTIMLSGINKQIEDQQRLNVNGTIEKLLRVLAEPDNVHTDYSTINKHLEDQQYLKG